MATLLRTLRERQGLTQPEMLDRLERRAREMGVKGFALSDRQFARVEAGQVKTVSRPANQKVIEAEFDKSFADLVAFTEAPAARARTGAPTALDASPTEHFSAIVGHLAQLDHRQGPGGVLGPATAVYASVFSMAKNGRARERTDCLRLAGQCAELIGWLYQDSGRLDDAMTWTARAFDLVEAVEAHELSPYMLMRRSAVAVEMGNADDALLLAEWALRHSTSGSDRALVLREVAAAHALNRNVSGFQEAVDKALDHAGGGAGRTPLTVYCTIPYLCSEAGAAALVGGEPSLAVGYLEQAVAGWQSGQQRDLAICMARLALAHAQTKDVEQAVAVATEAVRATSAAPSPRAVAVLNDVLRTLGPISHPGIEQVRHELSTVG